MKKLSLAVLLIIASFSFSEAQSTPEYKVITVVESIIPAGIGRSRLIESKSDIDIANFTTERTDGKKSDMGSVKRKNAKVDKFSEAKLLNFYSVTGIIFRILHQMTH